VAPKRRPTAPNGGAPGSCSAGHPQRLGTAIGALLVLHTWGQNLHHHPHVHGIVTGGGLACDAAGRVSEPARWLSCRAGFFLPVRVLSRLFRGKYLAGLRRLYDAGQLTLPQRWASRRRSPPG
jgi:Putative transposase.